MKSFIAYIMCLCWCISASATVLEDLDLHSNYIGDGGAIIFADTINPNSSLKILNLDDNHITQFGGLKLASLAGMFGKLSKISISGNIVGPTVGLAMLNALKINPNLHLHFPNTGMNLNVVGAYANLVLTTPHLPKFSALGVSIPPMNLSAIMSMLNGAMHLTDIDLSGISLGDMGAISLAGMLKLNVTLKNINLSSNGMTDAGAAAIAQALALMHFLESIDLTGNKFGPIGIMALKKIRLLNPNLKITFDGDLPDVDLDLSLPGLPSMPHLPRLPGMPDLSLNLPSWKLGKLNLNLDVDLDLSLPGLPSMPHLPRLPGMPDLSLNLPSWKLGKLNLNLGAGLVDFVIPHLHMPNLSLNDLHISGNMLGDIGAIKLLGSLDLCPDLGSLDLSDNKITFMSIPHIKAFILSHPNLETLNLSLSMIGDLGIIAIAETISQHPKLKTLILNETGCTNMGAAALGRALKTNIVLESLSLEGNLISDSGATALADGISANVALKSLNLGRNMIGPSGARSLASIFAKGVITSDPPPPDAAPPQPNISTLNAPSQSLLATGAPLSFVDAPVTAPLPFVTTDIPQSFTGSTASTGSFMDGDGGNVGGQFAAAPGTSTLPNVNLSPMPQTPYKGNPDQGLPSFMSATGSLDDQPTRTPSFVPPADTGGFGSGGDTMGMRSTSSESVLSAPPTDNIEADNSGGLSDMGGFS